jgi:outer membrane protein assembly factor BamC
MNKPPFKKIVMLGLMSAVLAGCDHIPFMDNTPDYKSAGKSRPLEVPPDLTVGASNDSFSVPGAMTYSEMQNRDTSLDKEKILPSPDNVQMMRSGAQRWLVVQAPPERIWPVIREFWNDLGFAIRVEDTSTGVMETEWVDSGDITKDENQSYLQKFQGWLDKLDNLHNREKFKTRLDRGDNPSTTEIYLTHRLIADSASSQGTQSEWTTLGKIDKGYTPQKEDPQTLADRAKANELDAELLRRLMVRLGIEDQKSKSIVANTAVVVHASLSTSKEGIPSLLLTDKYDRAWRRVGLALDRVGFVIEDKDRSSGLYYVRYSDLDISKDNSKKKGLLDSLKFWGDNDGKSKPEEEAPPEKDTSTFTDKLEFWKPPPKKADPTKQYRIKLEESSESGTKLTVVNRAGEAIGTPTAISITNILYEQLR